MPAVCVDRQPAVAPGAPVAPPVPPLQVRERRVLAEQQARRTVRRRCASTSSSRRSGRVADDAGGLRLEPFAPAHEQEVASARALGERPHGVGVDLEDQPRQVPPVLAPQQRRVGQHPRRREPAQLLLEEVLTNTVPSGSSTSRGRPCTSRGRNARPVDRGSESASATVADAADLTGHPLVGVREGHRGHPVAHQRHDAVGRRPLGPGPEQLGERRGRDRRRQLRHVHGTRHHRRSCRL